MAKIPAFSVDDALNKLKEDDSDKRYVGAQDVVNYLNAGNTLDATGETKLVDKLVDMVALDSSSQVRTLSARALGLITRSAQTSNLQTMLKKLSQHLQKDKHNVKGQEITSEVRDSLTTCLKAIIESVPDSQTAIIDACKADLAPQLVTLIKKNDADLVSKSLDVLAELVIKWGAQLNTKEGLLSDIQKATFPQLKSNVWACRNRASACLASVSLHSNDKLFSSLVQSLSVALADVESLPEHTLSYIQAITAVCRTIGDKFGSHLEHFVPTLQAIVQDANYDEENGEVRVNALQCFEAFMLRCPKHIDTYLPVIEELGLTYMTYDPNNLGEEEEVEDEGEEMMVDNDDDLDAEDAFGGDADGGGCPWKSAALHLLSTVISSRPDRLSHVYDTLVQGILKAFKEDDDSVRVEIFNTFTSVLRQTEAVTGGDATNPISKKLSSFTAVFVKAVIKDLKGRSLKTRPVAYKLLALYSTVLPNSLSKSLGDLIPVVKGSFSGKTTNSALKAEALHFLSALVSSHDAKDVKALVTELVPSVCASVNDPASQTCVAALQAAASISRVSSENSDIEKLYKAVSQKLGDKAASADTQVAAIEALASMIASAGDKLGDLKAVLSSLVQRLEHESTLLTAVTAFGTIAQSPKNIPLGSVLSEVIARIIKVLPHDNQRLKLASLNTLSSLLNKYGKEKEAALHSEKLVEELAHLINDTTYVGFSLKGIAVIFSNDSKTVIKPIKASVLPKVQELLKTNTLQGFALDACLSLYKAISASDSKDLSSSTLLKSLCDIGDIPALSNTAYRNVAKCVGALAASSGTSGEVAKKFLGEIGSKAKDHTQIFALYSLGEIGCRVDLSSNSSVKEKVLSAFESTVTEIRHAAAIALGNIAAGNLEKFLPDIIGEMKKTKLQYLLLVSIHETIVATTADKIAAYSDKLLDILFQHTANEDEPTRESVAESLGRLVLTNPEKVLTALASKVKDKSPESRATVVASLRACLAESHSSLDAVLTKLVPQFLSLIDDAQVNVRKEALLSTDLLVRFKPKLVRPHLATFLPLIYKQTDIIKELIETKEVGPFKITIDHAVGARQAAYSVMSDLLETCFDSLDLSAFVDALPLGLQQDDSNVRMLFLLIVQKLLKKAPNALIASIEKLVTHLKSAIVNISKDKSPDVDALMKGVVSLLGCLARLSALPDTTTSSSWKEAMSLFADAKNSTFQGKTLLVHYEDVVKTLDQ